MMLSLMPISFRDDYAAAIYAMLRHADSLAFFSISLLDISRHFEIRFAD